MNNITILLAACIGVSAFARAAQRPNIVFAFADDHGRHAGAYAAVDAAPGMNRVLRTPHIDSVARTGVLFRNAYVSAPSCTPCRSSLLSGRHFWQTGRGAILTGAVWDSALPSFPLLLRGGGYHIGKTYKVWSPGTPVDAPFDGQRHAYEDAGRAFNQFSQHVTRLTAEGMPLHEAKTRLLGEVKENFRSFLRARRENQPFFYWFGPTNTHREWVRGSGKALWNLDPDDLKGNLPAYLPDVPEIREDLNDYFGEVLAFDAAVGVLIEELKTSGDWENTILVISGDHGAPGFPRGKCTLYDFGSSVPLLIAGPGVPPGRVVDDFVSLPDLAPTFLELGGRQAPPEMSARSLVPLLRSEASGQIDPARNHVLMGRERHVDEARVGRLPYPQRAIRTRDHLYIVNFEPDRSPAGDLHPPGRMKKPPTRRQLLHETRAAHPDMDAGPTKAWFHEHRDDPRWKSAWDLVFAPRPAEELYQLRDDPAQMRNLAGDPAHAAVKKKLRDRLMSELAASGDSRVNDPSPMYERPPFAGSKTKTNESPGG